MRKHLLTLGFCFLVAASVLAQAPTVPEAPKQNPVPNGSGGNIFVGTRGVNNTDYLGLASEYDVAPQGLRPSVGGSFWSLQNGMFVDALVQNRGDARDQQYRVKVDLNRWAQVTSSFVSFLHRVDNDPLDYMDAAKGSVVLRHDNFAPGVNYMNGWSQMQTEIKGVVPNATMIRWRAGHRSMQKNGSMQARTLSKCSNCHVTGATKEIDQQMHELTGGVSLVLSHLTVDYDYTNRQFTERADAPMMQYTDSVHPASMLPVFGNRVQYDQRDGRLPYNMVPDSRKTMHTLKGRVALPKDARLSAAYTRGNVTNRFTGLDARTWAWNSSFTIPIKKRWAFNVRARQLDVDSDDVFVDVVERPSAAGPTAGLTYSEAYPAFGQADFLRASVRSRNTISLKGELSGRLAKLTQLRTGYEFRQIERPNYEIMKTGINRVYAAFSTRRSPTWQARVRYQLESVRDPFRYEHAALQPVLQPSPSPGLQPFGGLQYFTMYRARQATLTQYPTIAHRIDPTFTWTPNERMSATVHYRFTHQSNDQLNFSDWNRTVHFPGTELWFAPLENLHITAAYSFQNERSNSLMVLPVYDG
ncbi:MAG: hypothetical protein KIT83_22195 [Bryobacterales bacterium]|nr:hypothetical protein [Bryobacterales bacterium]